MATARRACIVTALFFLSLSMAAAAAVVALSTVRGLPPAPAAPEVAAAP